jgi:hypothetical protein
VGSSSPLLSLLFSPPLSSPLSPLLSPPPLSSPLLSSLLSSLLSLGAVVESADVSFYLLNDNDTMVMVCSDLFCGREVGWNLFSALVEGGRYE